MNKSTGPSGPVYAVKELNMKKMLLAVLLLSPLTAHAEKQWVDVPDVQRAELKETTNTVPFVFTDARYCTQYLVYTISGPYQGGVSMIPRIDQNGKPAIARRCTPTDPAPKEGDK